MSTNPEAPETLTGDERTDRILRVVAVLETGDPVAISNEVAAMVVEHNPQYAPLQSLMAHTLGRLLASVPAPAEPGEGNAPAPAPAGGWVSRLFGWLFGR